MTTANTAIKHDQIWMETDLLGEIAYVKGGRYQIRIGSSGAYFFDTAEDKRMEIEEVVALVNN